MIKACIFDLDGVIVDTAHYHYLAWKKLADELGVVFTLEDNERLKGVSRMQSLDIILELGKISLSPAKKEELAIKKNEWFNGFINTMLPEEIFPGVLQLIDQLKKRGIKIGLASSSKNALTVLRQLNITSVFEVIVDGTMITHTKPDPEIFLLAASRLHVHPETCIVFEDAEAGVEAALSAGMKCVGVGSSARLSKADRVVQRTADFTIECLDALYA